MREGLHWNCLFRCEEESEWTVSLFFDKEFQIKDQVFLHTLSEQD